MISRIDSFITSLITMLFIVAFCFFGIFIYREYFSTKVADEVEAFVSNISFVDEGTNDDIDTQEVLQVEIKEELKNENKEEIEYKENIAKNYFGNQLESYSKIIYDALGNNKRLMKIGTYEINLGNQFYSLLSKENGGELLEEYFQSAIEAFSYDNPDVFYIDYGKLYLNIETTTRGNSSTYKVFLNSGNEKNYLTDEFDSKEKIDIALNEIEKIKMYFQQNKSEDDYSNIKLAHDFLVESIEYDQSISLENIYDIYGALINKICVCEGYAKAFKYIMDALDIPCVLVSGMGTNSDGASEMHAWNYVKLEGTWYAIDCTWDDPIIIGPGILSNFSKYKYFLKGENEFNKSHFPDGKITEKGKIFDFPEISFSNY